MTRTLVIKLPLLCCLVIMVVGCGNSDEIDKEELIKEHVIKENISVQIITEGTFQYSENGKILNLLEAGKLERFEREAIWLVDDGFTLYIGGDKDGNTATLSGGRGTYDPESGHLIARDGVILINREGDRLKTEYLVWSHDSNKVHTNRPVSIETESGMIFGKGLEADGSFENYKILEPTGSFDLP